MANEQIKKIKELCDRLEADGYETSDIQELLQENKRLKDTLESINSFVKGATYEAFTAGQDLCIVCRLSLYEVRTSYESSERQLCSECHEKLLKSRGWGSY